MLLFRIRAFAACLALLAGAAPAFSGEADVVAVQVIREADGRLRFDVTLRHDDEGWDHYADGWEVVGDDGTRYGYRTLLHPHVNEQPFTRSLSGVSIPDGVTHVILRAHDLVHEWGGAEMRIAVPK